MTYTTFTIAACLLFTATALSRSFDRNEYRTAFSLFFLILGVPTGLACWAFPIYAFFVMPWWQVLAGMATALVVANLMIQPLLRRSPWVNLWVILCSIAALSMIAVQLLRHATAPLT